MGRDAAEDFCSFCFGAEFVAGFCECDVGTAAATVEGYGLGEQAGEEVDGGAATGGEARG